MNVAVALLASFAGWAGLALAMMRPHRSLFDRPPRPAAALLLRLVAVAAFVLALVACVRHWGWSIGPVAWLGMLSATALAFVFLQAYRLRFAVALAPAALAVSVVVAICNW